LPWSLECSSCGKTRDAGGLAGVCDCGHPYLVRYASAPPSDVKSLLAERDWTMWRYREWLPLADGEQPVTLGEGGTPLLAAPRLAARHGRSRVRSGDGGGGRVHAARTLSDRRKEDVGPRAGGTARLDASRRDRVSHWWRHGPHRHVESIWRAHQGGVAPRDAAAHVQR